MQDQLRARNRHWIPMKAFGAAILIGALLLSMPFSNQPWQWGNPLTALFTATSATCVTGLSILDIGTQLSFTGQIIVLCLIQVGGLGIMSLGTFLLVLVGRRLSIQEQFVLMDALGHERVHGLKSLLGRSVLFTLLLESLGAFLLAGHFQAHHGYSVPQAIYAGVFHAISAFCNAGFSLNANSLESFQSDPFVVLTIAGLIILGGLGFLVLFNLSSLHFWRRNLLTRGRLTLHSRIVLGTTLVLITAGWLIFLLLEHRHSLRHLPWPDKIVCAFFQSVTPRTAGFSVVDMGTIRPPSLFLTLVLMFVGGSPGSAAGGIKTTTAAVLILTVASLLQGREETQWHHRTIPRQVVREALSIFLLSVFFVSAIFGLLTITEQTLPLAKGFSLSDSVLFETVSAFGTVGLSTGITPHLSSFGQFALIVAMFLGRVGPLTLALFIGAREYRQIVRYPEEELVVG